MGERKRMGERKKDHAIIAALNDPEWRAWFFSNVDTESNHPNGCFLWKLSCIRSGHGQVKIPLRFSAGDPNMMTSPSRVAWFAAMNVSEPADHLWVLHECRAPACCRVSPDHVKGLGTASDNARDRWRQTGRNRP